MEHDLMGNLRVVLLAGGAAVFVGTAVLAFVRFVAWFVDDYQN